jgi:glycosyltransferase involved in cell wall biosynthesis
MRIIQIVELPYDTPVSGADLRNEALLRTLGQFGRASQIAVGDLGGFDTAAADESLAKIVADTPDIVVVEGVGLFDWAQALRETLPTGARIVFDFHNVESALLAEQDRARLPAPVRAVTPFLYRKRWEEARLVDREAIALADAVWTCSRQDQALAQALAGRDFRSSVIPNPVPFWCETLQEEPPRDAKAGPCILFLGHLGYPPNKVAVRRLAGAIMPEIVRRFPGARLTVAGRSPNARLTALVEKSRHAEIVANPADLAPLYRAADMVLLPLTEGGGSRIKVLEALAVGCPVVATAKAVEGLDLEPGRHYLAAETSADFAATAERLVREPELGARLRQEGMAFAQAGHGPDAIAGNIEAALKALDHL